MNKEQLTAAVHKTLSQTDEDISKAAAERAVNAVLGAFQEGLLDDGNVQLIGFGTFSVKHRDARKGRNPQTGKPLNIPAKNVVTFKSGKRLTEAVNPNNSGKKPKKKRKK